MRDAAEAAYRKSEHQLRQQKRSEQQLAQRLRAEVDELKAGEAGRQWQQRTLLSSEFEEQAAQQEEQISELQQAQVGRARSPRRARATVV